MGLKVVFFLVLGGRPWTPVDSGYIFFIGFGLGIVGRHLHTKPSKKVVKRCCLLVFLMVQVTMEAVHPSPTGFPAVIW